MMFMHPNGFEESLRNYDVPKKNTTEYGPPTPSTTDFAGTAWSLEIGWGTLALLLVGLIPQILFFAL